MELIKNHTKVGLQSGDIVKLQSKTNGMFLRIQDRGKDIVCNSNKETATAFKIHVLIDDPNTNIIRLEDVAGGKYLAIIKEYYCECGDGSDDCDLVITNITDDGQYGNFESVTQPGGHIRVPPTSLKKRGTEEEQRINASLFRVFRSDSSSKYIDLNKDLKQDVLQLQSKLTYEYLGVLGNGNIHVDYIGIGEGALNADKKCQFKVLPGATVGSFKLQNVAHPDKYLTIRPKYCVGYDQYTSDCDLHYSTTTATDDVSFVSFTSATHDRAIRTEEDGHITVSTDNNNNDPSTQFRFYVQPNTICQNSSELGKAEETLLDADNTVSDTSQTHTLNNDKHNNTDTSQSQHTERTNTVDGENKIIENGNGYGDGCMTGSRNDIIDGDGENDTPV